MKHVAPSLAFIAALLVVPACSHPSQNGFHFNAGETPNSFRLKYLDAVQIAKDYVAAHHVQFEIGQLRPYLVIYSEKEVLTADLLFETVTGKPNLKMTITDSGQVLRCVVGVSRD
jgi:hypothetical protein